MKFLAIHADFIEFQAKKEALKGAEKTDKDSHRIEECLVILTAVETRDEDNPKAIVARYVSEIKDIAEQVKAKTIVLYPYAHLSSKLAKPGVAMKVLEDAEKALKGFKVSRAPFGWYKSFDLKCKGHPLSELSREFGPEDATEVKKDAEDKDESEALKAERKLTSHWHILDMAGKLHKLELDDKNKIKGFEFNKYDKLKRFCSYEMAKVRVAKQEPPHVAFMQKLELVDYEPGSDPGNLRYYPKGKLVKGLLERYVTNKVHEYGALEIEGPIMFDFEHPSLKSYLNRFPARQYAIQTPNKKVFLRFAACFAQFLMLHDANISYKHLPLKMYEMTKYSFRVEQRGELTGLRRLRAFTMPDTHAFCADFEQAKKEMLVRFDLCKEIQTGIGLTIPDDLELAIRITRDFYEKNKDFYTQLVKRWGKPALIELWDERFFYFVTKYELNFVDALDKASALSTDQIDIENAERYDITYDDKDGKKKNPFILHCSPSGAIERVMYALLEKAYYDQQKGKKPTLPLWLAPTQVRLIPVSDNHLEFCEKIKMENVRLDLDDDDKTLGKKIRNAELEWIPYIAVVGDNEVKSGKLMVTNRADGSKKEMTPAELEKEVHEKTKSMPFDPLPLPKLLSKRPIFRG